jgi:hypothetical protein
MRKKALSDPKIAKHVLEQAINAIEEGTKKHGDTYPSFTLIAELWGVYLSHIIKGLTVKLQPHDVAVMMSLLKIARATYSYSFDNYVDEAGYTALAAMLHPTTHLGKTNESV